MAGFLTRHPDIELHLNATADLIDFDRDLIDLAIRYFDGRAADLDASLMYRGEARVYGRHDYVAALALALPEDVPRATLLATTLTPHWHEWLSRFSGLGDARIADIPTIHFDQTLMAIEP